MYYYLYEIRNILNDKVYVGVHKTSNLDDGYMGSGIAIRQAISKYGKENFKKTILFMFDNENDMFQKECEIVTEEFIMRDDVYNLRRGGHGGFSNINSQRKNINYDFSSYNGTDLHKVSAKKGYMAGIADPNVRHSFTGTEFLGKHHTEDAKRSIGAKNSIHQTGEKNSQFGTMWITDGTNNDRIKKDSPIPEGWRKGRIL